jgi:H+-transporting ATPase
VTRLSASEDAATMSVLCADKTGTMTMNKLSVAKVVTSEGYTKDDVILYGTLASQEANQDAIDLAFISAARDIGIPLEGYSQKNFLPFDATTRRTESTIEREGKQFRVLKGAVSTIVQLSSSSPEKLTRLENEAEKLESQGYRMVAVATDEDNTNTKLVGAVALYDKPRADSARLIANLKDLGISVKMLTGDALPVAREIANQLGLGSNIVKASETKAQLKDDKAFEHLEKSDGFAEIFPEDKYLIVKHLQKRGYSVGMTGDGVNDAPALKQAEVGIAVASATDVAKESASVVLTSEGLESIVELVKRGRMIYQRIITWVLNKIVKTFQIVVFVIIAYMFTKEYVVSVFSMILLLFLTDFVTLSLSTDNVRYSTKPDTWNIAGLTKVAVFLGIMMVIESFILLHIGLAYFGLSGSVGKLQTFVFDFLVLLSLFNVLIIRERKHFWESRPSRFLIAAIVADAIIVVLISVLGIPELHSISLVEALFVLAYSALVCFLVNDFVKVRLIKRFM